MSPLLGPIAPAGVPPQNFNTVNLTFARYFEAAQAQRRWAKDAVTCVDFMEGRQWGEEELRELEAEGRPALTVNKIAPLVRLVLGYERSNRYDIRYLPANDGAANHDVAVALTATMKQVAYANRLPWAMSDLFRDGIMCGRGYLDVRLDFSKNDFGEISIEVDDPFACYPDPHNTNYDVNKAAYFIEAKWQSLVAIENTFGASIRDMISSFRTSWGHMADGYADDDYDDDYSPERFFAMVSRNAGGRDFVQYGPGSEAGSLYNIFDPVRKTIRLIDMQHWVNARTKFFVDLETGQRTAIPDDWERERIVKAIEVAAMFGNPIAVDERMVPRVRWTICAGPFVIHDDWSPYRTFTKVPYYAYFRRGITRGVIHDLLDPQRQINKMESAETEILTKTSHAGWMYHENSLSPDMKEFMTEYGASPGINIEWKGEPALKPEKIQPSVPPTAFDRMDQKQTSNLKEISGINDSALGQVDRVQSGKAVEARQRQTVITIEPFLDNLSLSRNLLGEKCLELIQTKYTEHRIVRIQGENGQDQVFELNKRVAAARISNDVTVGNYSTVVDEAPASATFLAAQFQEALELMDRGLPIPPDIIIDLSTMPRKNEIKQRLALAQQAQMAAEQAGAAGGTPQESVQRVQQQSGGGGKPPAKRPAPGQRPGAGRAA